MALLYRLLGLPEVRGMFAGAAARMKDTRRARRNVGDEMLLRTQQRMRAGLDIHGRAFKKSGRVQKFGGQTLWNSGAMERSANYAMPGSDLELFSTDKSALVHFLGKTIKPKTAKFLTIPIRARGGLFAVGQTAGVGNREHTRARHFKNTFFLRRKGKLFLMQRTKGGAMQILFILVKQVKLPRREWLGFGQRDLQMAGEVLGRHVTGDKA